MGEPHFGHSMRITNPQLNNKITDNEKTNP